jgi:hypothetical protein
MGIHGTLDIPEMGYVMGIHGTLDIQEMGYVPMRSEHLQ